MNYNKIMNENHKKCIETGQSLEKLKEVILSHWIGLVKENISNSKNERSVILMDHIPSIIDQLIEILKKGEVSEVELGKSHGFQRAVLTNYSLGDIFDEYSLLRKALMQYLYPMGDIHCAKLVHKFIDIISKHSAIEFLNDQKHKGTPERQEHGSELEEIKENPLNDNL
jgi:hypothetical protein